MRPNLGLLSWPLAPPQSRHAAMRKVTPPVAHRTDMHPENRADLLGPPPFQCQQDRPRPVRLAAMLRFRQGPQPGLFRGISRQLRFSRHLWPPQSLSQENNPFHRPFAGGLPRKWSAERVWSCGFGPGFEGDVIAEAFEAALEIGNSAAFTDLVEIGFSEIAIDHAPGEHVISGHDNLVSDGQGGTQRAAPGLEAVELFPQIACLLFAPRKWRPRPASCADARWPFGPPRSSACPRSRSCRGKRRPRRQGGGH